MASRSQASYVARLAKAEQLHQYLLTFTNYAPGDNSLTTVALMTLITNLHVIQDEHTQTQNNYLLATEQRRKRFDNGNESINKLLSPIGSFVKAKVKDNTKFYQEVNALIYKIRGAKKTTSTNNESETSISYSEKSYGSQLQNFKDIITLLTELGTDYQPANDSIKLPFLQDVYNDALLKNNEVSKTISLFKPNINKRQEAYKILTDVGNGIKNMVKSQYGTTSTEYTLVKGILF